MTTDYCRDKGTSSRSLSLSFLLTQSEHSVRYYFVLSLSVGRPESSEGRLLLLSVEHPVPVAILEGGEGIGVCRPSLLLCGFFTLLLLLFLDVVFQLP